MWIGLLYWLTFILGIVLVACKVLNDLATKLIIALLLFLLGWKVFGFIVQGI